jgi:hypothetical protein
MTALNIKKYLPVIVDICVIGAFFWLPYYLFAGKLYIGGDDTRLFYSYPYEFYKNVAYFAWYSVSSTGIYVSNQYLLPFLTLWILLKKVIPNEVIISYFAFSSPLILGYIFMKKFIQELFDISSENWIELRLGNLFYLLSPIIIINQLFIFLTAIWLLGVIPMIGYFYIRYLKTGVFTEVFKGMIVSIIFSFSILALPWLLGLLLPLLLVLPILVLFHSKKEIELFIKRSIIYFSPIIASQAFWVFGFIAPYLIKDKTSYADKFLSAGFLDTFSPTVLSTAVGTIMYPLLNLFHRQIAFDFGWKLKNDFLSLYDHTFALNFLFLIVFAVGVWGYKRYLDREKRGLFLTLLLAFLIALYFFTVNIGPLKDLFLLFGRIPGFVMFRNFFDKFAPGYVIIYSILMTVSLVIFKKQFSSLIRYVECAFLIVVLINFSTVKSTVNSPLWTTDNVYKTIRIPDEYLNFMQDIRSHISSTNNILSIPFGSSTYTVIKDSTSENVYVGVSPVKIFSGVNDISGHISFNFSKEANSIDKIIIERRYEELRKILHGYNINYVLVTNNIPKQVLASWIYDPNLLAKQDAEFMSAIAGKKVLESSNGHYILYETKDPNILINSTDTVFRKLSPVKYELYIRNLKNPRTVTFNDTYHDGWKLFPSTIQKMDGCVGKPTIGSMECPGRFDFFSQEDLGYLFEKIVASDSHTTTDGISNSWLLKPEELKKMLSKESYTINKDGSINVSLTLYFKPQLYLYYGLIISVLSLLAGTWYMLHTWRNRA